MALVASLGLLHPQILSLEAVPFKGGRSVWGGPDTRLILMSGSNTATLPPAASTVTMNAKVGGNPSVNLTWGPSSDHAGKIIGRLFAAGDVANDHYRQEERQSRADAKAVKRARRRITRKG